MTEEKDRPIRKGGRKRNNQRALLQLAQQRETEPDEQQVEALMVDCGVTKLIFED